MDASTGLPQYRAKEVAKLFLKLGFTAFGGPAAHISMFYDEAVERRKWINKEQFLDLLGATNLIPGPNSTEMAIHLGFLRAGWTGLILAGVCFIVPAMLIVIVIAWLYTIFERTPPAEWMLYGVQPVVIVIILQAMINLGKTAFKNPATISAGIVALVLYLLGYSPILVLILASLIVPIVSQAARLKDLFPIILLPSLPHWKIAAETAQPFSLMTLFLTFLKIGSVLYGSGYVLLAFLESDFVHNLGWLTEKQLLEAVAVGQFTPGPVFTTATFIGYIIAGLPGAVVATIGIFLPSFIFVAISNPYIPKIRSSPWAGILLDGLNAASLGLMSAVALQLSRTAFVDLGTIVIGIISGVFLFIFRTNTTWLILAGLSIGLVIGISRLYLS